MNSLILTAEPDDQSKHHLTLTLSFHWKAHTSFGAFREKLLHTGGTHFLIILNAAQLSNLNLKVSLLYSYHLYLIWVNL